MEHHDPIVEEPSQIERSILNNVAPYHLSNPGLLATAEYDIQSNTFDNQRS
jgi:hypothetical protein